jgi:hypothetical protein
MITSVMLTGDAGGLRYVDDVLYENPKAAFKNCCSTDNTIKAEYNFAKPINKKTNSPQKKNIVKQKAPL